MLILKTRSPGPTKNARDSDCRRFTVLYFDDGDMITIISTVGDTVLDPYNTVHDSTVPRRYVWWPIGCGVSAAACATYGYATWMPVSFDVWGGYYHGHAVAVDRRVTWHASIPTM